MFILFLSGVDFFVEGDLRKFKDGIYFIWIGAEATEDFALNSYWADDVLSWSFVDLFL